MPWSGGSFTRTNGVNTGATLWAQDRDDGTKILATRHDTNDQDMADGINSTLEKSGSNAATGNLNIGSNRLTAVADGTAKTDAATVNQIQSNAPAFQATDTGTANTHVIALSPAITAYAAGQNITFKAGATSTGASTLNVNTLGAKALKKMNDQDIAAGDIESGSIVSAVYDGTNFQVTSQLASEAGSPGGSNTQVQYNSSGSFAGDADLTFDGTELTAAGVNLAAFSGVLEANANFVDQVIFGPSVDGRSWNGVWSKASLFSSLMLATVEDAGADSQINIWDLTTKANTSPLGTVTLSGDATPTSIAACMGYIIVGSEDGISIIDPHGGSWAERTADWPRSLSTSSSPALTNNDVQGVAAGLSQQPAHDPRTNGPLPTFACSYGAGADACSIIKNEGAVYDKASTIDNGKICLIHDYKVAFGGAAVDRIDFSQAPIDSIVADDWSINDIGGTGGDNPALGFENCVAASANTVAGGDGSGLSLLHSITLPARHGGPPDYNASAATAQITRAVNSGYYPSKPKGVWLANSKTADLSTLSNTLTENGTVTEGAVESGAELKGYSGFSDSTNYFSRAFDADFDFGTGDFTAIIWFKRTGTSGAQYLWARKSTASGGSNIFCSLADGGHTLRMFIGDGSNSTDNSGIPYTGSVWNQAAIVWDGSLGTNSVYINGVLRNVTTNASVGSLTNSNATLAVGATDNGTSALDQGSVSLFRLAASAWSASAVRQSYEAEKGMFVASAECLLQSGSTDAVLDTDVDPLTEKVLVTQTDAITVFKKGGLVVDSKPTVNSGTSEKGKLWGDLRAEQNSANAYVTAPATDQRQVNEMVRGLASDLPKSVDLSTAKALLLMDNSAGIDSSFNIKSITDIDAGIQQINLGIPMKTDEYFIVGSSATGYDRFFSAYDTFRYPESFRVYMYRVSTSALNSSAVSVAVFGECEND